MIIDGKEERLKKLKVSASTNVFHGYSWVIWLLEYAINKLHQTVGITSREALEETEREDSIDR